MLLQKFSHDADMICMSTLYCAIHRGFAGVAGFLGYTAWPPLQPGAIQPERRHAYECFLRVP
jgi:hypothetical protein